MTRNLRVLARVANGGSTPVERCDPLCADALRRQMLIEPHPGSA